MFVLQMSVVADEADSCGLQLLEAADAQALGVHKEQLGGKAGSRKKSYRQSQSAISLWVIGCICTF